MCRSPGMLLHLNRKFTMGKLKSMLRLLPALIVSRFQDFKIYYITQAHMCNISKHNNIIQYVNIENMGDREGIYFRLIHYIQYTFNI